MKEFYLDSCGGGRLHCAIWTPEGEPKAVVQLIHGIAEHIGRYDDFARFLNAHGYVVAADDHMGHGGSVENGVKGYFSGGWLSAVEDEKRLHDEIVDEEISIGDYVLTGGELPALVLTDTVCRLVKGVLSDDECFTDESHFNSLLEYPQYTRPPEWRGRQVPDVLLSGHHLNIAKWRREMSLRETLAKRPDLLKKAELTDKEQKFIVDITKKVEKE